MLELYRDIIESSSQHIFELFLQYGQEFSQELPQFDDLIRPIIREVSRLVIEKTYTHHAQEAIFQAKQSGLTIHRKISIKVFTLYGPVSVPSPYLYNKQQRLSSRPVRETLGLYGEMKSQAFERAMTDFGAERSFGRAALQFKEHYGWEVGESTIRTATLKYAKEC